VTYVSQTNKKKNALTRNPLCLPAHQPPSSLVQVKAVAAAGANGIISASRDATVRLWQKKDGSVKNYDLVATISAHSSFVNSVAWVSPNQQYPNGIYATPSKSPL